MRDLARPIRIGALTAAALVAGSGTGAATAAAEQDEALLIVAPKALAPAMEQFVREKQARLPTELVDVESVLGQTGGADDPERLKRFIFERWRRGRWPVDGKSDAAPPSAAPLGYVLLVGDADVMPVRYMVLDRNTEPAFNYAFYPSDLYYADLAKPD